MLPVFRHRLVIVSMAISYTAQLLHGAAHFRDSQFVVDDWALSETLREVVVSGRALTDATAN